MTNVKIGSLWRTTDDKKFRVINVVEANGHTWVHYRNELKGFNQTQANEYSCYVESFVERFSPTPE